MSNTPPKAKLILTGASGYLGQHLLAHWYVDGVLPSISAPDVEFDLMILYHKSEGFEDSFFEFLNKQDFHHPSFKETSIKSVDLTDPKDIETLVRETKGFQKVIVVHTAALSSPRACEANPEAARAINVPTKFFDALLKQTSSKTSIMAFSTDQVYDGKQKAGSFYKENEKEGLKPVNVYGQTKLELENYLAQQQPTSWSEGDPLRAVFRSSIILGPEAPIDPGCAHDTFLHFCKSRGENDEKTTFFTNEYRSVIRVDKVIRTIGMLTYDIMFESSSPLTSLVYNMGGPFRVNRMELAKAVFAYFHYNTKLLIEAKQKSPMSPLDISIDSSLIVKDISGRPLADQETTASYLENLVEDALDPIEKPYHLPLYWTEEERDRYCGIVFGTMDDRSDSD